MEERTSNEPRIIKIATCPSLSARTSITYHLGVRGQRDVCFRIWGTSGKGVFSKEWVCASDINKVLAQHAYLAAATLLPVFQVGRSVNTAGFLLAVLKAEGLVVLSDDEPHKYVRVQSEKFIADTAALIDAGVSLDPVADAPPTPKGGKGGKRRGGAPVWPPTDSPTSESPGQ